MKPGTGPWFQPKTTVPGHGVGWRPAVATRCHGVVAHRAAWPDRRGGHGLPMAPLLRGRGQGHEGGGRGALGKRNNSAAH
jgi:hypothetical protein